MLTLPDYIVKLFLIFLIALCMCPKYNKFGVGIKIELKRA